MKWYLIVVLTYISLVMNDMEQFFLCLLAICISYFEKRLFRSFVHLKIVLLVFLLLCCKCSLCIIDASPLSDKSFANSFSHSVGDLFIFFIYGDEIVNQFCCCSCASGVICKEHCLTQSHEGVILYFLLKVLYVLFQFSCSVVSNSLQPCGLQPTRLPCPSPTPRACSNSCPSSWWCHMFGSYI